MLLFIASTKLLLEHWKIYPKFNFIIPLNNDTASGGLGNDRFFGGPGNDTIFGQEGNDTADGEEGNDLIGGDTGDDIFFGSLGNDTLLGGGGIDTLVGGVGSDSLNGGSKSDLIIGVDPFVPVFGFGRSDIDTLTGGQNADTYVLGTQQGASDVIFYNDGNAATRGTTDYALITDFGFFGDSFPDRGSDIIQLAGSGSDYSLGASLGGLPSGTGIFFNQGTPFTELIGILQGISLSDVSLADTNQFTFV